MTTTTTEIEQLRARAHRIASNLFAAADGIDNPWTRSRVLHIAADLQNLAAQKPLTLVIEPQDDPAELRAREKKESR